LSSFRNAIQILDRSARITLLIVGVLLIGGTALEILTVGLIFPLVKSISGGDALPNNGMFSQVVFLLAGRNTGFVPAAFAVLYFAVVLIKNIYNFGVSAYQERLFYRVSTETSTRLLRSYLDSPWSMYLQRNSADMTNVADSAAGAQLTNVLRSYLTIGTELLVVAGLLAILLAATPWPTLTAALVFGGGLLLAHRTVAARIETLGRECTQLAIERLRLFQQAMVSAKEIKVLGRVPWLVAQYGDLRRRENLALRRVIVLQSLPRYFVEPALVGIMTAGIVVVTLASGNSKDTLAVLGLFAVAGLRLLPSLTRILAAAAATMAGADPVARIGRDLALVTDCTGDGSIIGPLQHQIAVENLRFRYPGAEREVLRGLSLTLPKGSSTGLVGSSGAGKTTLADLLLALLEPSGGRVAVDGVDVREDKIGWWRQIGYVPQTISLVDASLRENVALGIEPGLIDDARIWRVLALVQLDDLANGLAKKLDTRIGERGVRLSGGERQRIGMARALYDGRTVLVLDEATSALDALTESEIGEAIHRLHGQCTILVIAHRLSTIRNCDAVVMLADGEILDRGPFEALAARCVPFKRLVDLGGLAPAAR